MTAPILVTGAHRSGTTWVGQMLSLPRDVGYVHEPFNPTDRPGTCRDVFGRWYTHIDGDWPEAERCIRRALAFDYDPRPRLASAGSRGHSRVRDAIGAVYQAARSIGDKLAPTPPAHEGSIGVALRAMAA